MKIERISENQVKFVLSAKDLSERNLKLTELSYGNEKTQELFRDMMEAALEECDFFAEQDTPLIIEAIPTPGDSICIIVTKTTGENSGERHGNILENLRDMRRRLEGQTRATAESEHSAECFDAVFGFKSFDDCAELADRLFGQFSGNSSLYFYDKTYFLALDTRGRTSRERQDLDFVLMEYSKKQAACLYSFEFLKEHGETIVETGALAVLWDYYNA